MTDPKIKSRVIRDRKKGIVPLSKLRASDVVKTVLDHPRRLDELVSMLEDKERGIQGRAAATLARLSESYPARLLRILARLKEGLTHNSAYVRWHMVYTLGQLGSRFPAKARNFLNELGARLDDENRIVRILACKALRQMAARRPLIVEEFFQNGKREVPPTIARVLRNSRLDSRLSRNR
jgi:hypothetical protein